MEKLQLDVIEVNGNDIAQVIDAFARARKVSGKPAVIIAHTVKVKASALWRITRTSTEKPQC